MPVVIPPGFGQAAIYQSRTGDPEAYVSVFGIEMSDALDPNTTAAAVAGRFAAAFETEMPAEQRVVRCQVRIGQDGGPPVIGEWAGSLAGAAPSNLVPQNSCTLVRWSSGLGGRRGRGRTFLPWVHEGGVSNTGELTPTAISQTQTCVDDFLESMAGDPAPLPLYILHAPGLTTAPAPTLITGGSVANLIATQRRRLRP